MHSGQVDISVQYNHCISVVFSSFLFSAHFTLPSKSFQVVSQTASNSAFGGGSLVAGQPNLEKGKI